MSARPPALLVLEDGTVFRGRSVGAAAKRTGELVFHTGMTGYQEILTDPSYRGQIVVLTYPHVGNYGINPEDEEAGRIHVEGFVVREVSPIASNWRARTTLSEYLERHGIPAIDGIDTRALTRRIRTGGAMRAVLSSIDLEPGNLAREARAASGTDGRDLVREVTCAEPYEWEEGFVATGRPSGPPFAGSRIRIVAVDCGIKRNILRSLVETGADVTVVPAHSTSEAILALSPAGVFFSNGPGDPAGAPYVAEAMRGLLGRVPVFGICLGHQMFSLAVGARTHKMKFGHHGANHPVQELVGGRVVITSQNHGFAVDEASLPAVLRATHRSLFDGSLQGIARTDCPAFGFQGHPEASPGPHDLRTLFEHFVFLMVRRLQQMLKAAAAG